jgi:hypothetical protein
MITYVTSWCRMSSNDKAWKPLPWSRRINVRSLHRDGKSSTCHHNSSVGNNFGVERIAPLRRVWEVPGSNIFLETGYRKVFVGFPRALQTNAEMVPQTKPWPLSSTCFPVHYSLISLSFDATQSQPLITWPDIPWVNIRLGITRFPDFVHSPVF